VRQLAKLAAAFSLDAGPRQLAGGLDSGLPTVGYWPLAGQRVWAQQAAPVSRSPRSDRRARRHGSGLRPRLRTGRPPPRVASPVARTSNLHARSKLRLWRNATVQSGSKLASCVTPNFSENRLLGGVARSAGWVCSRFHNPPQGLTALAPPERGAVKKLKVRSFRRKACAGAPAPPG
jgi:hypothetical protein